MMDLFKQLGDLVKALGIGFTKTPAEPLKFGAELKMQVFTMGPGPAGDYLVFDAETGALTGYWGPPTIFLDVKLKLHRPADHVIIDFKL